MWKKFLGSLASFGQGIRRPLLCQRLGVGCHTDHVREAFGFVGLARDGLVE